MSTFFVLDPMQGGARRGLLALLLASALAHSKIAPGDADAGGEHLGVVGAARGYQFVDRLGAKTAIGTFLQRGLVAAVGPGAADIVLEQSLDRSLGRLQSAVGIDRADHGLERRGENRHLVASAAFLFALAQP